VEPYLSLVATLFPDIDTKGEWDLRVDWRFSKQYDEIIMRTSLYSKRRANYGKSKYELEIGKMEAALREPNTGSR
jgi:hypothetical protein